MATTQSGPDDDPDQKRLDDLGRRIEAVRDQHPEPKPATPSLLGIAWRMATEFVAAVFVGAAVGVGFDRLTGLKPFGLVAFLVLGFAAGITIVYRTARKLDAQADEEQGK